MARVSIAPVEERSRRIVRVAIELAERGGFEGVRLRDVAAHADVALGTLYRRFRSKEELLLAALELQVTALEQRMRGAPPEGATPLERVTGFFRVATEAMCSRPQLARALVRAVVAGGPELSLRVAAFHHRMEAMIARALRGGGEAPPTDVERRLGQALLRVWFASLSGWASGLHGVEGIADDTNSAADLLLGPEPLLAGGKRTCLNPGPPRDAPSGTSDASVSRSSGGPDKRRRAREQDRAKRGKRAT